jgi:tRNA threonylcarbamoyladenosine biosynthesis protein TsaE
VSVVVRRVGAEAAPVVLDIVEAAFAARPPLDPPADALGETEASLALALVHGGLVASVDGADVGALVLDPQGDTLWLRRFGVRPDAQASGIASALVAAAMEAGLGYGSVAAVAREELPGTVAFWRHQGFVETARRTPYVELRRPAARAYDVPDADTMRSLGSRLARLLRAGDLVVLTGELGAGKTTFTQGIGAGLDVRGDVTSPTFVIARVHPPLGDGPALVHADAYRLGGVAELDDLDLDTSLDEAVTVVEWGSGIAEGLADDRLDVRIERALADDADVDGTDADALDPRLVVVSPVGARWLGVTWPG